MPYFVIGVFFCSFYLMNLVLAVVYLSYEQELCSEEKEVTHENFSATAVALKFNLQMLMLRNVFIGNKNGSGAGKSTLVHWRFLVFLASFEIC